MYHVESYKFLRKQVLVLIVLSLVPGFGYIILGWINDILLPALVWYGLSIIVSGWGYHLYRNFQPTKMNKAAIEKWYVYLRLYFYLTFSLWTLIFLFSM